ncbi:MAG TPA: Atrophin-1 multi-domain protein [Duganella sp.]
MPTVGSGALSLEVFKADADDGPMKVHGKPGTGGVGDPDVGGYRSYITMPRWPVGVTPASGGDGHCDIVDTVTGIVHSFYQLKYINGKWTASMYSWSRVDGRGWGDADHWSQGARASGVPPSGGLIRKHEIADGAAYYNHALAMSLPAHTLANGLTAPSYIYPATTADNFAATNTGKIPLGARLMLPESFDTSTLTTTALRKVANTLKRHGAYVVDSNYDTAFSIYVENGTNYSLMPNGWDENIVRGLEQIRAALRQVIDAEEWVDGDGKSKGGPKKSGLLSMRGVWMESGGTAAGKGKFDSWQQAIVFPTTATKLTQINYTNGLSAVSWSKPANNAAMRFAAVTQGGARIRIKIMSGPFVEFDSGFLNNGVSVTFKWPHKASSIILAAESGVNTASQARGVLTEE